MQSTLKLKIQSTRKLKIICLNFLYELNVNGSFFFRHQRGVCIKNLNYQLQLLDHHLLFLNCYHLFLQCQFLFSMFLKSSMRSSFLVVAALSVPIFPSKVSPPSYTFFTLLLGCFNALWMNWRLHTNILTDKLF